MPQVWVAGHDELDQVAGLIAEFPRLVGEGHARRREIRRTAAALLRDPGTEFLLAAPERGAAPAGL